MGTAVFANDTVQDIPNNDPVVVTRKQQSQKVQTKQPQKKVTRTVPPCGCTKQKVKNTAKKQNKSVYTGLTIYKVQKPKQKVVNVKKPRCIDDPKSICNTRRLKVAKPYYIPKVPRYSRTYNNKYRKFKLPDYPPLKPAKPIEITTCY